MVGRTLGHYKIESQLGSGGMGSVYLAFDATLHRRVAIKVLTAEAVSDSHAALLHEARAASALNHPNICTVYEVAEAEGHRFIVMEYVHGRRLAEAIPDRGFPVDSVLRYGTQLAGALAHAHDHGVVHRDLKSSNVVLTDPGHVKILDFGLARVVRTGTSEEDRNSPTLSATGAQVGIVGTLAYMAPEVLCGQAADVRSDVWALGVMLYEMATGRLPFDGRGTFELSAAILREPPAPFAAPLPSSLRGVILRCLAKEPAQRYHTAAEVAAALEAIHSDVVTGPVAPAAQPRRRAFRLVVSLVAVAAVAAVGALVLRQVSRVSWVEAIAAGRLQRLVASETQILDAALSPDGKVIAYVGEAADGQLDLFVLRVSGGEPVRLTSAAQREAMPRFSPDGERIAFTRLDLATGFSEVCIIPTFGGDVATVMPRAADAAWSPDGTHLAFVRRPRPGDPIALMSARIDGSDARVQLAGEGAYPFVRGPTWSPDGRTIAFVRGTGGVAGEIWLVPVGGGPARRLSEDRPEIFSDEPRFTPDGRGVLHSSNRGGAVNLWFLPVDGSAPTRITTGSGPDDSPSVATDGRVVFANARWRKALVLYQVHAAESRVLLTDAAFVWGPAFSPDGREIVFSRGETDGSWHLWTVGVDGSRPRQLTASPAGEIYPRFTRDGQWLLFHSWRTPHVISRARRNGREATVVTTSPGVGDAFADVSPDGRTIVFTRSTGRAEMLFTAPITGGTAKQLTSTPGAVPRWSPDGRHVAFSGDRNVAAGIFVARADGTDERRLSAMGGWPVWWPDGRRIGFMTAGISGNQEVHVVAVTGGEPEKLSGLRYTGTNNPFDISPDGTAIVTSNAVHVSTELWLLDPAH